MKTIWKFGLDLVGTQAVMMPVGATILTLNVMNAGTRAEHVCLWAMVDADAKREHRLFRTYGAGHVVPDDPGAYVGTYRLHHDSLVFHVFEELPHAT